MSLIGKNWKEWPVFHPRRTEASRLKIRKDGRGNIVTNVADTGNEQFSPAEWEEFSKGAEREVSRLAVSSSRYGPGRMDVEKISYRDGTYHILPTFYPNNLTDEEVKIGKRYSVRGERWPFKDGAAAMQAAREELEIVFKIDQKKGV